MACGGGGGGGGGGTTPPPPQAGLTFTPAGSPSQQALTLVRTNVGPMELELDLRAVSVGGLYGVAFDLTYPANLLRLDATMEGDWLNDSGASQTSFLVDTSSSGRIVVGLTRLGAVAGESGSGTLVSLRFTAVASGNGSFTFSNNQALDSAGQLLPSQLWVGGTVRVQL